MIKELKLFYPATCLILLFAFPPETAFGQAGDPVKFSQISTMEGLSQGSVNCILKDRYGFMWFGTQDGLNRFDGYNFTVYRNKPGNSGSIPDNQVRCIYEDDQANLWIGTLGGGLCYYDRNRDVFIRLKDLGFRADNPVNPAILSIYADHSGNLWVGTFHNLLLIDRKHKKIRQFRAGAADSQSLSNPVVQAIFEDSQNNLWVGTNKGLNLLNREKGIFTHFFHDDRNPHSISSDRITSISEDPGGHLWIGTDGGGLNVMDSRRNEFISYRNDRLNKNSISDNVVRSLCATTHDGIWVGTENGLNLLNVLTGNFIHYNKKPFGEGGLSDKTILSLNQDNNGILWVGTSEGGINKYDRNLTYFELHRRTADPNSTSAEMITSFAEDKNGNIWIGTDGGGLDQWRASDGRFIHYLPDPGNKDALEGSTVLSLFMSRKNNCLWIGTYGNGLQRLDLGTGTFSHFHSGTGMHDLNNASIYALLEDHEGNIWMGTNGGGVNVLDPRSGIIIKHRHTDDADSVSNDYIRSILEDRQGKIWIGTYSGGISVYDPVTKKFSVYNQVINNLSNQVVYSLWEDSEGNMWAGTMGGGLDLFDRRTRRFTSFNEENGLSNNIINSIIGDNKGYLWLSTNKGISRFNLQTREFKNYGIFNGLQSREFIVGAGFRTRDGSILFGGVNGFNVINPSEVRENKIPPYCRFTGFYLFNKPAGPGNSNSPLRADLNAVSEITLSHDQSDFTFTYSALNYTIPSDNQYRYILEGFDKSWTDAGHDTRATYTNLPPGDYRFLVKATNNDGLGSEKATSLIIHILPPFWKTWWAYSLYLIILFTILYIIYRDITNKARLKAQIRVERLTADKMKELNRIKLNFFTHVSHELRTPLSLIMDPLRKMIREDLTAEQTKKYSGLMYKNAQRLMQLIDQMLDLRKIEEGHLKLQARPANIILLTKNIAGLFNMHAIERNIHYSISTTTEDLQVWIDQDKFEKIIFNLISNAFKYTADNGSIMIRITSEKAEQEFAVIHVRDTGVGIPPHLKSRLFEMFYQVEDSNRYENGSTGIGLTLTRELIELHKGHIEVESEPGKGSDFIIYLPMGDPHTGEQPTLSSADSGAAGKLNENIYPVPFNKSINDRDPAGSQESGPLLLLVEDNKDLRGYLKEELSRYYSVEDAADGSAGYEKALHLVPDLLISDIMMPEINGIELCRKIKTDERTSHIPVILLTAKQAGTHQIEGYSAGADAYVPKPFNLEVLLARIKNLLDSRKKLRELYGKEPEQAPAAPDAQPQMNLIDREFLNKTILFIAENLSDVRFDIDRLSSLLKVSRRQLYRKIKALTNQTVHDFVTGIRLKKAASLLLTGEFTISEIAYKVGFSEPANFSRSFTRQYGKSPRRFVAEYSGKNG